MADPERQKLLAKAHLAAKALGLNEDMRRDVQRTVTGRESCAQMTPVQLRRLLDHYRALGWRPAQPSSARPNPEMAARVAKIRALWYGLFDAGVLRVPRAQREQALRSFCRRTVGLDAPEWVGPDEAATLIAALKAWRARET